MAPSWHTRRDGQCRCVKRYLSHVTEPDGCPFAADAGSLIRCLPGEDRTNGFFVSLFVRGKDEEDEWTGIVLDTKKRKAAVDEDSAQPAAERKRKKKKKSVPTP